jgi:hypothetical protein
LEHSIEIADLVFGAAGVAGACAKAAAVPMTKDRSVAVIKVFMTSSSGCSRIIIPGT